MWESLLQSCILTTMKTPSRSPYLGLSSHFGPAWEAFSVLPQKSHYIINKHFHTHLGCVESSVLTSEPHFGWGVHPTYQRDYNIYQAFLSSTSLLFYIFIQQILIEDLLYVMYSLGIWEMVENNINKMLCSSTVKQIISKQINKWIYVAIIVISILKKRVMWHNLGRQY